MLSRSVNYARTYGDSLCRARRFYIFLMNFSSIETEHVMRKSANINRELPHILPLHLLINGRLPNLHERLGIGYLLKTELCIEAMSIAGGKHKTAESLRVWMFDNVLHEELR